MQCQIEYEKLGERQGRHVVSVSHQIGNTSESGMTRASITHSRCLNLSSLPSRTMTSDERPHTSNRVGSSSTVSKIANDMHASIPLPSRSSRLFRRRPLM